MKVIVFGKPGSARYKKVLSVTPEEMDVIKEILDDPRTAVRERRTAKEPEDRRPCMRCGEIKQWGPHLLNFCDECVEENLLEHGVGTDAIVEKP